MNLFTDELKIKDALQIYFSQYHFKDGGYNDRFFKIKVTGSLYIPLPNIKARLNAVKIHDIHHLVTGYNAFYKGEAEIGAWEIGSGCGRYWVAWVLNLGSFLIGMLFYQRSLFMAFMNGRHAKTNLYKNTIYNEALLNRTVGELRKEILPRQKLKNSFADYLMFFFWCIISVVYHFIVGGVLIVGFYKCILFLF